MSVPRSSSFYSTPTGALGKNHFKYMRFLLTLVLAITTGVMAKASDFVVDGIHYNILSATDKTVEVTHPSSSNDYVYRGDIIIPASVKYNNNEFKVVAVGAEAFSYCSSVTSVDFGVNVETIGKFAFLWCERLTSLTFNANLQTIEASAFNHCTGLKEVSFNGSIKIIKDDAFKGCKSLLKIEIPGNVETIGSRAFENCLGVEQLIIHNGVKSIGASAFAGNGKITEVSIPESVEFVGADCFYVSPNTGIKVLKFEDGEKGLAINSYSPWVYSILDKLYIGRNDIRCNSSEWFTINAKEITVGRSVKQLRWYSYSNLETIKLHCMTPPGCSRFYMDQYSKVKVIVPVGCLEAYQKAEPWCRFKNIQEDFPSAIDEVEADTDEVVAIYAIDGTPCAMNDKGVKVVKMKSGKTMKVVD